MEPLDLWERYIDPSYRERAVQFRQDAASGTYTMLADGKPMPDYAFHELLGDIAAYGQKEEGRKWGEFDSTLALSPDWQDMDKRVQFLDQEGIDVQVVYPSLALLWEFLVEDPVLADAHCRAYNTWAFELAAGHKNRLYPGAHLSLRDPQLAVRELERTAKLGGLRASKGNIAYTASKFGVVGIAQSLAQEVGPYGITVNTIHPGTTDTELLRAVGEEKLPYFMNQSVLGVMLEPRDIANAVVWLASDEARYVTGHTMVVDAGFLVKTS